MWKRLEETAGGKKCSAGGTRWDSLAKQYAFRTARCRGLMKRTDRWINRVRAAPVLRAFGPFLPRVYGQNIRKSGVSFLRKGTAKIAAEAWSRNKQAAQREKLGSDACRRHFRSGYQQERLTITEVKAIHSRRTKTGPAASGEREGSRLLQHAVYSSRQFRAGNIRQPPVPVVGRTAALPSSSRRRRLGSTAAVTDRRPVRPRRRACNRNQAEN